MGFGQAANPGLIRNALLGGGTEMVASEWTGTGTATATQRYALGGMQVYSGSSHPGAVGIVTRAAPARPWRWAVQLKGIAGPNGALGVSAIDASAKKWICYYNANNNSWQVYNDVVTPGTFVAVAGVQYSSVDMTSSYLQVTVATAGAQNFTWGLSPGGSVNGLTISTSSVDVSTLALGAYGGTPGAYLNYVAENKSW